MFEQFPDIVSIDQISTMLNIGKSTTYTLLKAKQIQHVKVGRRYIVPKKFVIEFLGGTCYNEDQITDGKLNNTVEKGELL